MVIHPNTNKIDEIHDMTMMWLAILQMQKFLIMIDTHNHHRWWISKYKAIPATVAF